MRRLTEVLDCLTADGSMHVFYCVFARRARASLDLFQFTAVSYDLFRNEDEERGARSTQQAGYSIVAVALARRQ